MRGRWFEDADRRDAEGVAVINQAAADRYYPDVDPLGRRIKIDIAIGFDDDPERTIVGVVGNARSHSATEPDDPTAYVPNAQFGIEVMYVTMKLAPGRTHRAPGRACRPEGDGPRRSPSPTSSASKTPSRARPHPRASTSP